MNAYEAAVASISAVSKIDRKYTQLYFFTVLLIHLGPLEFHFQEKNSYTCLFMTVWALPQKLGREEKLPV